jgi:hypothetical protein
MAPLVDGVKLPDVGTGSSGRINPPPAGVKLPEVVVPTPGVKLPEVVVVGVVDAAAAPGAKSPR